MRREAPVDKVLAAAFIRVAENFLEQLLPRRGFHRIRSLEQKTGRAQDEPRQLVRHRGVERNGLQHRLELRPGERLQRLLCRVFVKLHALFSCKLARNVNDRTDQAPPERRTGRKVSELSEGVLETYARLWQLETWLRRMVYVELRAQKGDDWAAAIDRQKVEEVQKSDKRLTHMATPEQDWLSYMQFSQLRTLVRDNRPLFEPYLPPKNQWEAKSEEVEHIRHRIAHFRSINDDDLRRVEQLLRDVDQGFWRFCTSFNDVHPVLPQTDDPVVAHFLSLDLLPWAQVEQTKWARVGHIDPSETFGMIVETLRRPWAKWAKPVAGNAGLLYDVTMYTRGSRHLDYTRLLPLTRELHPHMVYICLDHHATDVRLTIPALLGADRVIETVELFLDRARSCIYPGAWPTYKGSVEQFADSWPEYVLSPENPLTFLSPDQPCSFFDV